jgi:hypothetical protein
MEKAQRKQQMWDDNMRDSTDIFDVKNLSSRKLWVIATTGSDPELQQLAEQELSLRRYHLEQYGSVYSACNLIQKDSTGISNSIGA